MLMKMERQYDEFYFAADNLGGAAMVKYYRWRGCVFSYRGFPMSNVKLPGYTSVVIVLFH